MGYRPDRIGEMSVRASARVAAENGDERAKRWLERSMSHAKRQRAEARAARKKRQSKPKKVKS